VATLDLFARREPAGRFSRESLARELNEGQLAAVVHPPRPLLVVAGAGSGKTRVITYRLARLVAEGAEPRRMLAVTFTNKAAAEMRGRVGRLLAEGVASGLFGIWIGTFHAVAARLLRRHGDAVGLRKDFVIYDDDDQRRLMTRVLADLGVPERLFPVRQVMSVIDRAKNQGIDAGGFTPSDYFDDVVSKAYRLYEERLAAANATDFGGLLLSALKLCHPESPAAPEMDDRFDHVLVDEFQDTNSVQYRLVRFLSRRTNSITVVGDEDQSIYKWRGADIRNILDFERDHPGAGVVKLEQNYRSTAHILRAANAVIARNTERRPKNLFTLAADGAPIVVFEGETERDEAEFVAATISSGLREDAAPRDFAVFYRTNGQSRVLEEALRGHDLPYVVVGGTRFYDRSEIKDLIAYLRVLSNPDDGVGLLRIINVPARGIGDATVDKVAAVAAGRGVSLSAALALAAADEALLGAGPRRKVAAFCEMMTRLRTEIAALSPAAAAELVLELSGYRDALAAEASMESEGRIENLLELVAQMREYEHESEEPTLSGFLERIALASDVDGYDPEKGAISLMTVHTAKGLEFPRVFLSGLEEGVFPHARSIDDDSAIEEERRLCYVAVTRAEKRLYLTRVRRRRLSGQELGGAPSRFLKDLPVEGLESLVMPRPAYLDEQTDGAGPWGGSWSRSPAPFGAASRPRRPAPAGQITVHYDEDASPPGGDELGLRVGAKLSHPKFGVGEVRGWQSAGADLKVTMRFPTAGVKTILARFLRKT
jgi:DNA helicase-2/ATP-dependent DNA helicase PcrA